MPFFQRIDTTPPLLYHIPVSYTHLDVYKRQILASHTVLATAVVPLVLTTLAFALKGNFDRHRKWARWTWPIWMYVCLTGVGIYFFLKYGQP